MYNICYYHEIRVIVHSYKVITLLVSASKINNNIYIHIYINYLWNIFTIYI